MGTPYVLTTSTKAVDWKISTDPFGETVTEQNGDDNNFRFPGQYADRESGLNYNWHRYYQPKIGRYYETDPSTRTENNRVNFVEEFDAESPSRFAPYLYANNNPYIAFDPEGLSVRTVGCNSTENAKIQAAAGDAEAAGTTCLPCDQKLQSRFAPTIRNLTFECIKQRYFQPKGSPYLQPLCGRHLTGTKTVQITPFAFSKEKGVNCGCLKSVVLHETLHALGVKDEGANNAYVLAKKCFNCARKIPGGVGL